MKSSAYVALIGWLWTGLFGCLGFAQSADPLFARGYHVIPAPQRVTLRPRDFIFGHGWSLKLDKSVPDGDVAVEALQEGLKKRFHVKLWMSDTSNHLLVMRIQPGSLQIGKTQDPNKAALEEQAYRIDLKDGQITITANAPTGLFYGAETFLQLLKSKSGALWLPEGTIEDWPDLQLRLIFWDDSYHLERMAALRHAIRQAAFYKVNGFVLKLDGHFQYKGAPAVVEPYALSAAQLRQLMKYGRHFHVRLIPYLDGPANVAFILKHPEYKNLREFPDSNYEICTTNPASYKLLQDMSRELIYATEDMGFYLSTAPASDYFFLSTANPYFLGMADNSQCNEASLAKQLGSTGQVYVHFIDETGNPLRDLHRIVLFWGMDPLQPNNIASLPYYLINSYVRGNDFNKAYNQRKLPQLLNAYVGGKKYLFPSYYLSENDDQLQDEAKAPSNAQTLAAIMGRISTNPARKYPNVIGEISTGWGNEGTHPETFWMGYIAGDAAGWHPGVPDIAAWAKSFYSLFYGNNTFEMDRVYQLMAEQAQVWADSWEWAPSHARKPLWGGYQQIYHPPKPALDQTIPLPPSPDATLAYHSSWSTQSAKRIAMALQAQQGNAELSELLNRNIQQVQFNRYNLEVYRTIANLYRQNLEMLIGIHAMDAELVAAAAARNNNPETALHDVDHALDIATSIWQQRNQVMDDVARIWDKDWFPRISDANGRHFLHELDDVQNPLADRTVDLSYLIYREKQLPFGEWVNATLASRNRYAMTHHLAVRNYTLAWDNLDIHAAGLSRSSKK